MAALSELGDQLRAAADAVEAASEPAANAGAYQVKRSLRASLVRVAGSDLQLTRGGASVPVGVHYRVAGDDAVHTARVRLTGAAHWIDRGTNPHEIRPKRSKVLALGNRVDDDEVARGGVTHPGARSRPFFAASVQQAGTAADQAMTDVVLAAWRSVTR